MNAIFTIVAKNYLPLAFAQAETLKKHAPGIDYSILLADSAEGLDIAGQPYPVVTLDALDIKAIETLEFKYNITEFCTAVKPYYFTYLFEKGFKQVIYLDPDVCAFASLEPIFKELGTNSINLTPHFISPEIQYSGTITESLLLHVGVFNCGFIGVRNSEQGRHFIKWWENRLYDKCYQDKIEAFHTDQKWVDLAPALYGSEVLISRDIGRNMAFWNLHERQLIFSEDDAHQVVNRFTREKTPLLLFHFAGYDIKNAETVIHKNHAEYNMNDFPELRPLFTWYRDALIRSQFREYITLSYGFNTFANGDPITAFQRRLYRALIEAGHCFPSPFATGAGSFHELLKKNNLLSKQSPDSLKSKDIDHFKGKIEKLNRIMRILKKTLGTDRYALLLKFCQRYFRPENQTFLFNEFKESYRFKNENENLRKRGK